MSIKCNIIFNFDVIYPGQVATGNVVLSASDIRFYIEHIIIEICGTAECAWTNQKYLLKPLRIYKKDRNFVGKQQFFRSRHTIASGNESAILLGDAVQEFGFKTSLPQYLPSTWTGRYGTIKYAAKVMVKEKTKTVHTFSKEFGVRPRRNLKLEKHLLYEARKDVKRNFRYAVINLGNVYVSIWLPLSGIAAGQSIPLLCTILNKSTIQFGGLIFILTQTQIFRSNYPRTAVKKYRKDICRIPRMVDILQGKYQYYCVLETDSSIPPTNQLWQCKCCQLTYEVWVSLQGAIPRYSAYGYPNVDTPGIPIIVGTEPLCEWNSNQVTHEVMREVFQTRPPVIMEQLPPDDDIEELLNNADEELDAETEYNLTRQLANEPLLRIDNSGKTIEHGQ